MLASLDPLGMLLAIDVVAGNLADDPLCVPCYQRVKEMLTKNGLLIVGDSKMSALNTRTAIAVGNDYYLTPLPHEKSDPGLLEAFDNINLSIVHLAEQTLCQVTPLTDVQKRILSLLGLSTTLYTNWTTIA